MESLLMIVNFRLARGVLRSARKDDSKTEIKVAVDFADDIVLMDSAKAEKDLSRLKNKVR